MESNKELSVDYESQSIMFLEEQMDGDYKDIVERYELLGLDWIEDFRGGEIGLRAYGNLKDIDGNKELNMIILFPPFFPKDK
ncbi:MAG: hypothetical protein CME70_05820 [Halobacteriovorax sp.]|nr:hypothetical protein [Halobacteriovorax sp.]|tara:strand:- start:707 stop:952 length:246 start_codon:yes stop_codon:yes gene_type:complete